MIYTYDGTFFGYLSAVFDGWHRGVKTIDDIHPIADMSLFGDEWASQTDDTKAGRILASLQQQCGRRTTHLLYYAFLAEQPHREMKLLRYMQRAFSLKEQFMNHLSEPDIWEIRQWARKSSNERHKLLGLLRFREVENGMLYGAIAPTCCVVPVMAPHFAARLANESWVIHDTKRHMGVYYDKQCMTIVDIPKTESIIPVTADEEAFAALWKEFYRTIAIKERSNDALRRSFMPKKYWPYIIEMKNLGNKE